MIRPEKWARTQGLALWVIAHAAQGCNLAKVANYSSLHYKNTARSFPHICHVVSANVESLRDISKITLRDGENYQISLTKDITNRQRYC